jgi:hypothetical protein
MTRALDQLAELVRQAEAKTLARRIESETQQAAERFRIAEQRSRRAVERHRTVRPAKLQSLEQTDIDEQLLKDLVRKLALYKSSLGSQADAEKLIAASQAEIERTRRETRAELEEIGHELEEARRELRVAIDAYRQLRRELERLQPELAVQFATEDRLLWDAESYFPGGQLQLLAQEVEAGMSAYASLSKLEQYARLKVWIGRFRFYQAMTYKRYHIAYSTNSSGFRASTSPGTLRHFARISLLTGLCMSKKPKNSSTKLMKHCAASVTPIFNLTPITNREVSTFRRLHLGYSPECWD